MMNWRWKFIGCASNDDSSYHSNTASFTLDLVLAHYGYLRPGKPSQILMPFQSPRENFQVITEASRTT